jgi:low affinity Fe/Cu permease
MNNDNEHRSLFDKFADKIEKVVGHAGFFTVCVLLVVVWLPSYFVVGSMDTWQLIINTLTTIITFLLVALLQNTQERFERSVNARLQAILEKMGAEDPVKDEGQTPLAEERGEA